MRIAVLTVVAGLMFGGLAFAGEDCLDGCPTAKKVTELNAKWEVAAKQAAALTAEQKQDFAAKVKDVAKDCPVGCRMGETLALVRDVLELTSAPCKTCDENCPIEKLDPESELAKQGKQMKAVRTAVLANLKTLATHASGAVCSDCASSCSDCDKTDKLAKGESCDAACAMQKACPIRIASRIGALRASYKEAGKVASTMKAETRAKILTGFGELAKQNAAVTLVPDTVFTLAEGFAALNGLHAKMLGFVKANPKLMADVPEAVRMKMMMQIALVDETHQLLGSVTQTMKTMQAQTPTKVATKATN